MDNNESINSITDIEVLRGYLHETTQRLQTAAQMGLELAQQNSALQSRLGAIEQTQDDMRQRLALVERDRRWMQDQSLRVDQIKASLNDIILKANGSRSHRCDQQIDRLDYAIEKLKDDINAVAQTLESVVSTRKWTTEMSAARKSLAELTDKVATLEVRLKEVQEQANTTETRHRSHHAELTRCLNENTQNIQTISEERSEAQAHINSVASHQRDIEQSLQSVIHEYNAMLNEHEQAIRVLSESHALLEAQTMAHHAHSSQYYTNSSTPSTLTPGIGKYQQILPARYSITPVSGTPKHSSTYKKRDSGIGDVQTKRPPMKQCESLDDIFANDQHDASKQKEQLGAFPSPPLSTAGEPILDLSVLGRTPVRKAASVIGTPSKTKRLFQSNRPGK
ncbi:hypothetical protein BX070DRAFT_237729 [Coemansia spiralis]|nr:hypothetical protein BX070DRAFT_237729 [Coemansia spiralis]